MSARPHPASWTREQRAHELVTRRSELLRRLPREIRPARGLRADVCELIVDDAIEFASLHHEEHIASAHDLEAVFWSACVVRVQRARAGRYELIRGRFRNAGDSALGAIATDEDPVAELEARHDRALAHEFSLTLEPVERRVLRAQYDRSGHRRGGYKVVARELGIPIGVVRSAELSIEHKIERFAAVYTAGRLCDVRAIAIGSLAAGTASDRQAELARAHVEHCGHCRPHFAQQLRELGSDAFAGKVAGALPALPAADDQHRRLRGAWDALVDTLTRPFTHDATSTVAQLAASGAGRGAGTIVLLKIASACLASATAVGVCATTLVIPALRNDPPATPAKKPASSRVDARPVGRHQRIPTRAEQQLTPTPTPTPKPSGRKRSATGARGDARGGTGPTDHEQPAPASPAPSNAAPDGSSEFSPDFQPSEPPAPAPAPAAPGANEFISP